jgi:hypothetical protein
VEDLMTMMNVNGMTINVKNGKLTIEVDVSKEALANAKLSNSGKSKLVASTGGSLPIGDGLRLGLNVMADK